MRSIIPAIWTMPSFSLSMGFPRTASMNRNTRRPPSSAGYFFGGPALHYFALALTVGICCSVYSSVFVAAAIAMYLKVKREDLVHKVKKAEISEMVP